MPLSTPRLDGRAHGCRGSPTSRPSGSRYNHQYNPGLPPSVRPVPIHAWRIRRRGLLHLLCLVRPGLLHLPSLPQCGHSCYPQPVCRSGAVAPPRGPDAVSHVPGAPFTPLHAPSSRPSLRVPFERMAVSSQLPPQEGGHRAGPVGPPAPAAPYPAGSRPDHPMHLELRPGRDSREPPAGYVVVLPRGYHWSPGPLAGSRGLGCRARPRAMACGPAVRHMWPPSTHGWSHSLRPPPAGPLRE